MAKRSESTSDGAAPPTLKLGDLLSQIPAKWAVAITIVLTTGGNQALGGLVRPLLGIAPTAESAAIEKAIEKKIDSIVEHQNETHRELDLTLAALPGEIATAIATAIAPLQQRLEDNTVDIRVLQALEGISSGGSG